MREHAVSFNFVHNCHLRNLAEFTLEQLGHAVGVAGVAEPQIIFEQSFELSRKKAHLGRELHALLAVELKVRSQRVIKKDDCLGAHPAIFCCAERENINAQVAGAFFESQSKRCSCIGDSCSVHMQEHVPLVCESRKSANLVRLIDRAHLCRLSDRYSARLNMVLVADSVISRKHGLFR